MKSVSLKASPRSLNRRGGSKKLRTTGNVPAVIYGRHAPPQNLEVNEEEIEELLHHSVSENLLVDLAVANDARANRLALVREIQHHPLSGNILHIDLQEVVENEKITLQVPVETTGEAAGVKTGGGTLEHVMFKLRVRALPKDLPEFITIDVSHLEIGKAVHIGEIKPPAGVEILGDKHQSVVAVAAPMTEEQEAAAAAEATAAPGEVEMIKEKKEEGEEGAAPAKAGDKAAAPAKGAAAPAKGAAPAAAPAKGAAAAPAKGAEKKK